MPIQTVTIVPGTESRVGEGLTGAVRCIVRYPDHTMRAAIVKRLPTEGVTAEAFCALLLRGWGLKVPDPAIVQETPIAFASVDAGFPNLNHRLGWSATLPPQVRHLLELHGAKLVTKFAETPRAISVDEVINNRDRNFGNILWDGGDEVVWIDHERALGLSALPDVNKLVAMVLSSGQEHAPIQTAAVSIALTLSRDVIANAQAECLSLETEKFSTFVTQQIGLVASKVLDRFPQPQDLLSEGGLQ